VFKKAHLYRRMPQIPTRCISAGRSGSNLQGGTGLRGAQGQENQEPGRYVRGDGLEEMLIVLVSIIESKRYGAEGHELRCGSNSGRCLGRASRETSIGRESRRHLRYGQERINLGRTRNSQRLVYFLLQGREEGSEESEYD